MTSGISEVRERAAKWGAHTLTDVEALQVILARSIPKAERSQDDAARLLRRYKDLRSILAAGVDALAPVVGLAAATDIAALASIVERVALSDMAGRDLITSWAALSKYLVQSLGAETREQFRVLFLDKANRLIADEVMGRGTVDHAPVYPREVMRRALELECSAMILAHNHPAGSSEPSDADVKMTRQLIKAAEVFGIKIHDHVIVARGAAHPMSFRERGLI